jgi:hypothetical protein
VIPLPLPAPTNNVRPCDDCQGPGRVGDGINYLWRMVEDSLRLLRLCTACQRHYKAPGSPRRLPTQNRFAKVRYG